YNQVSREIMYSWVNRHLNLDLPEPVVEKPFVPIPPAELSVFDAEHRRPDGVVDAAGLRKLLSEASDRQIAALAPRDAVSLAEHRRVVGTALRAILKSSVPCAGEVEARVEAAREVKLRDVLYREEKLILTRTGTAEAVPALYVEPEGWKGTVVVAVSPAGKDGLFSAGEKDGLGGAAEALLEKGAALLAPDVFLTGDLVPPGPNKGFPVDPRRHGDYAGYTFGYNRAPLANRAHDVLTAVGHARARPGTHTVHLLGEGEGGLWAILARGLAGDAVRRTLVDRPALDFTGVKDVNDLRFLPGGVKYGGWGAFAALAAPEPMLLRGEGPVPPILEAAYAAAGVASRLRQEPGDAPLAKRVLWLLE
ncbi:MAG TPA: hypothetical protein VMT52_13320, partial [Planctomycetota bacterium]|nr:hypothetical protein [Planctomycetota bacterium]